MHLTPLPLKPNDTLLISPLASLSSLITRLPPSLPPSPSVSHLSRAAYVLSDQVSVPPCGLLSEKHQSKKREPAGMIDQPCARASAGAGAAMAMGSSWSWRLRLLFLASLLVLTSAVPSPLPRRGSGLPPELTAAEEALLARMCDPRTTRPGGVPVPLAWCHELHLRRHRGGGVHQRDHHHHRPAALPPPGRDGGEDIDPRYGVAKRLVPTGPNPLHN